jgi:hypothetical protein
MDAIKILNLFGTVYGFLLLMQIRATCGTSTFKVMNTMEVITGQRFQNRKPILYLRQILICYCVSTSANTYHKCRVNWTTSNVGQQRLYNLAFLNSSTRSYPARADASGILQMGANWREQMPPTSTLYSIMFQE